MELWYTEKQTPNVRFSLRCDRQLFGAGDMNTEKMNMLKELGVKYV